MNPSTLRLRPREEFSFDRFIVGANGPNLEKFRTTGNTWLYGIEAVGKTHLANALVRECCRSILVDETSYQFQGLEDFNLVILDGFDQWLGSRNLESDVLELYEKLLSNDRRLVVTTRANLNETRFVLRDLQSRMQTFYRIHVLPVGEDEKPALLHELADQRGMEIPDEVVQFLLVRIGRSQAELLRIVETLESESLLQQRVITVPFAKGVLQL